MVKNNSLSISLLIELIEDYKGKMQITSSKAEYLINSLGILNKRQLNNIEKKIIFYLKNEFSRQKLQNFLEEYCLSVAKFCQKYNLKKVTVYKFLDGRLELSTEYLEIISKAMDDYRYALN